MSLFNGDYDRDSAIAAVEEDRVDFIAFGKLFIANPDLPQRLRKAALTTLRNRTLITPVGPKAMTITRRSTLLLLSPEPRGHMMARAAAGVTDFESPSIRMPS